MIVRFDHAVVAMTDLEAGMSAFRRLGFEVEAGGRHPSLGTRNAIVRFGLDYLELLAVEDPDRARAAGRFGADLVDFLADRGAGLAGYVLAGSGLDREAARFRALGIETADPFYMNRMRPDGGLVEWRLVVPGGSPWRKPWPYLIDWITGEEELTTGGGGGGHPSWRHQNRVGGVAGISLRVDDVEAAVRICELGLGLADGSWIMEGLHWCCRLGRFVLDIYAPAPEPDHPAASRPDRWLPGPDRLVLSSADLAATSSVLRRNGVRLVRDESGVIDIHPQEAMGAPIRIASG